MKEITTYREMTEDFNDKTIKECIGFLCDKKSVIMDYFKKYSENYIAITCPVTDYVTGEKLEESILSYTDNIYCWTNEEIYHFEKYDLKLNDDFIKYVLSKSNK